MSKKSKRRECPIILLKRLLPKNRAEQRALGNNRWEVVMGAGGNVYKFESTEKACVWVDNNGEPETQYWPIQDRHDPFHVEVETKEVRTSTRHKSTRTPPLGTEPENNEKGNS